FLLAIGRDGQNRHMSEGGSQRPGGLGKKRAAALQIELHCATLDDVRAAHPELRSRRFLVRTKDVRPLDAVVRLDVKLAGGAHCLRATSVVERVQTEPEAAMTLWLAAADDAGRELIAWIGGTPPPLLKESADPARAAEPAPPAPAPDDDSELADMLSAFEAAAAAADRAVEEPKKQADKPTKPKAPPPPPPPPAKAAPAAKAAPSPAKADPTPAAKAVPSRSTKTAPPPPKTPPAPPPPAHPQKLGAVQLVSRAVPAQPADPESTDSDTAPPASSPADSAPASAQSRRTEDEALQVVPLADHEVWGLPESPSDAARHTASAEQPNNANEGRAK